MTITVYGTPAPQGSKRFVGIKGGRGVMIESSKAVKPWREAVKCAALDAMPPGSPWYQIAGPIRVRMVFTLPKPKSAPKGRITYPDRKPDLSKLVRATEDALTDAGVWQDDARVIECVAVKAYPIIPHVPGTMILDRPGCVIEIEAA